MLTKSLYDKIYAEWKGTGETIYQKWSRVSHRLPFVAQFFDAFKGRDVLELGCNAGLYGREIASVAKSYVGVDRGSGYVKQSKITQKYIDNPNVQFINVKFKKFIRDEQKKEGDKNIIFNAFFASFALYHLNDKEVQLTADYVLPRCRVVIIMTRTRKRKAFRTHNSHKFHKPGRIVKWLSAAGFTCAVHWPADPRYAAVVGTQK